MKNILLLMTCCLGILLIGASWAGATVNLAGGGSGTVTSSPAGIDCGSNCTGVFVFKSDVTLTAAPDATSIFLGWSGNCSGTDTEITITMNDDKNCTATFEPATSYHSLTVSKDGNGTGTVTSSPDGIDCGHICANYFATDRDVTLTGTPDDGSALHGWSGVDCPGNGDCKVTMDRDRAVTATFNTDSDGDGISDDMENAGPNNGDGNGDGIPDSEQGDVATFLNISGTWTTMITDSGRLEQVTATTNPSPDDSPSEADFSQGFFGFKVTGLMSGASVQVTLFLHTPDSRLTKYYRYGPTFSDTSDHWYQFDYDNTTGLGANVVTYADNTTMTLHLKDGGLGDDDLTANGEIADVGASYAQRSSGDSGGGSCFFNTAY